MNSIIADTSNAINIGRLGENSKYYSEQAAASAAAAAQHSMGVSVSGNTLVFTNNVKEGNE